MILIIDDYRELLATLELHLITHGYAVHCSSDAKAALEGLERAYTLPELILLDIEMPGLDGRGFLVERLKIPNLETVPIVLISGCGEDLTQRAKQAGAVAFLAKPIEAHQLLQLSVML